MSEASVRDRTREFFLTTNSVRDRLGLANAKPPQPLQQRKRFSQKAAQIGKDIHRTAEKLNKLTKLAKSKSLFDDPAAEISELSYVITQDIHRLNEDLDELGSILPLRATHLLYPYWRCICCCPYACLPCYAVCSTAAGYAATDAVLTRALRPPGNIHQLENTPNNQSNEHASSVKKCLQSNLKSTAENFAAVLQVRSENLSKQQSRRNEYSSANAFVNSSQPSFLQAAQPAGTDVSGASGDVVIELGAPQMEMAQEYSESRALSVQDIEKSIHELANVFTKLGEMVSLQQEQIERIDTNMEEALHNVDEGHSQLVKYYQTLTGNRALMAKIFFILLISLVFLIIFGT